MKPLLHRFETDANKYVYDVNSNRVVKLSEIAYHMIEDFREDDLQNSLTSRGSFRKKAVKQCFTEINRARKERGLFLPSHPNRMAYDGNMSVKELAGSCPSQQLILNVTEQCNLRCKYCIYGGRYCNRRSHSSATMDFEIARQAIDQLLKRPQEELHISFYGGEPLLNLNLIQRVVSYTETVTSNKVFWNMTTNGNLLTKVVSDYLRKKGFLLMISLDGPREVHDRYRVDKTGQGSFDRILTNLAYIQAADPDYYNKSITFSVVSAPPYNLSAVAEFFASHSLVRDNFISFSYMDHAFENFEYTPTEQETAVQASDDDELKAIYFAQIRDNKPQDSLLKGRYENDLTAFYQRPKVSLGEEIRFNGCCFPGARRLFVSTEGTLHVCERMDSSYPIGRVSSWIDPNLVDRLVQDYADFSADCFNCWACRLCTRCFAAFSVVNGKFDPESRASECSSTRSLLHNLMVNYYQVIEHDPCRLDFLAEITLV